MPPTPRNKQPRLSLNVNSANKEANKSAGRNTLSELSQNVDSDDEGLKGTCRMATIDGQPALSITKELLDSFARSQTTVNTYIAERIEQAGFNVEIHGWSKGKLIPSSFYDDLFKKDSKIKQLTLRGRGHWDICKCPSKKSTNGVELIDLTNSSDTTAIERLYVMRPFQIKACSLLDLIARSPLLKEVRFYGVLTDDEHHKSFNDVRFACELERLYWPWCNRKFNLPTVKLIVKRNDKITAFYSNGDTTCDLLGSDLLPNLKYLSLILNESWVSEGNKFSKANRYLKKIANLSLAKKLEALEIRTLKLDLDEFDDEDIEATVRRLYENYQLSFWENVAKIPNLKFLAIYGAWDFDSVARELARHGLQIELLRTNLLSSSMLPAIDAGEDLLVLSMYSSIKELRKLTKLRSLHFACHENLANIDSKTVTALKELADLIWTFDLRIVFTPEVEELIANMIRRGNQQGKVFNIKLQIECSKSDWANAYVESIVKFSSPHSLRQQLTSIVELEAREKYGRNAVKTFHLWGIEQAGNRDRSVYDKLKSDWDYYEEIFRPVDMFA